MRQEDLDIIPTFPQQQTSTSRQLSDLIIVANKIGLCDAADAIKQIVKDVPQDEYGCFCEAYMTKGVWYDVDKTCVIDEGMHLNCIHAKHNMRKEQCSYWRRTTYITCHSYT